MSPLDPAPSGYAIKLVRDDTEAIINPSGEPGDLWYEALPVGSSDWRRLLTLKLGEEVTEYLVDGGVDELADVIAVIQSLAVNCHGLTLQQLAELAASNERGGFLHGVVMYGRHDEFDR